MLSIFQFLTDTKGAISGKVLPHWCFWLEQLRHLWCECKYEFHNEFKVQQMHYWLLENFVYKNKEKLKNFLKLIKKNQQNVATLIFEVLAFALISFFLHINYRTTKSKK